MTCQVNVTSSAVSGLPSLQRRPFLNLNVQVFLSSATDHDSASPGATSKVFMSIRNSVAWRNPMMSVEDDSLAVMGLNVLGSPKVDITRRPPGWPGSISYFIGGSGSGLADCPPLPVDCRLPQPALLMIRINPRRTALCRQNFFFIPLNPC